MLSMKRGTMVVAEVLAIALVRAVYLLHRDSVLPKGSMVRRIRDHPVYRFSFRKRVRKRPRRRARPKNPTPAE